MKTKTEPDHFAAWANRHLWLYGCDLETEWLQATQEGRKCASVEAEFRRLRRGEEKADYLERLISGKRDARWFAKALALIDQVQLLPRRKGAAGIEPDDLPGIRAARGKSPAVPAWRGSKADFERRVRGGFLGRVAGCMLGKPFEGMDRKSIRIYAEETGNWPLHAYQRQPTPSELRRIVRRHPPRPLRSWQAAFYIDRCDGFPSDDDINYTVIGMELMRRHRSGFAREDVASLWLGQLPILSTCTAERVAYRNFVEGCLPPRSATRRNPFREWIGAQIRADFFGYAAPGKPALAAEWAWRDASISHVQNGIYGEMWVAAMLSACFVLGDWSAIVRAGLAQIPRSSRLHTGIDRILGQHEKGVSHEEIINGIHAEWDEFRRHDWCHVIPNAQIVAASLLAGGDFGTVIARSVAAGFDTDCNGATCGSLWGVRHGESSIPRAWLRPLRNRLRTNLMDYQDGSLDAMAQKMATIAGSI